MHFSFPSLNYFLFVKQFLVILTLMLMGVSGLRAQGSIELARYLGGSGEEKGVGCITSGGYIYIWSTTGSSNLPVTNGSTFKGNKDIYVAKLNSSGGIVFAGYLGGTDMEEMHETLGTVIGDDFYLAFTTYSSDLPVTNGSSFSGMPGTSNLGLAKINSLTGVISFCGYGGPFPSSLCGMKVAGGKMYVGAIISAFDNPIAVTDGSSFHGGTFDIALASFNGSTGNRIWETYWGSSGTDFIYDMDVEGNNLHLLVYSDANTGSMPSTNGTSNNGGYDILYAKLNASNASTYFLTYLGGSGDDAPLTLSVVNGETYILGSTNSFNFPSTTGALYKGNRDAVVTKYSANGAMVYSTIIGGSGNDAAAASSFSKHFDVSNGSLCFVVTTDGNGYPITNSSVGAAGDVAVTRLNAAGQIVFSSYIGSPATDYAYSVKLQCDDAYVMGGFGPGLPTTNGTTSSSVYNTAIARFNTVTGKLIFSSYIGDTPSELNSFDLSMVGNGIVQAVTFVSPNALPAVTLAGNSYGGGPSDLAIVRINTSNAGYAGSTLVSPASQNICANGTTSVILMDPAAVPGTMLPLLYVGGVPSTQADIPAQRYQWQIADASSGPWTDVPGASGKNFTPPAGALTKYYRRQAFYTPACGTETLVQTGDAAAVIIDANTAPVIDAGGPFVTCAGTPVTLGGSPTATANGGASIVSYLWTPADAYSPSNTSANPQVAPAATTIYTVSVTDNNGCQQTGQALVNVYSANAGPAKSVCGGQTVRIGTAPMVGVPGVSYSWTALPADPIMSCTNCAQPDVHPSVSTTYTLTLTFPVTGGGNCSTTSSVTVSVVAAPVNNGGAFGGADVTICSGGSVTLGTTAETGFTYTWSPGSYLSSNTIARPSFFPGTRLPVADPMRYYVTASKNGCSFVDSIEAFVLKANAGEDGCGPRLIGSPDATPAINETYTWTKITNGTGTSNFLGATNLPQVPVSNATVATAFRLTVTYNGVSCTDDVIVSPCGGCVLPTITVNSPNTCASYSSSGGQVTLTASSSLLVTYSWSPAAGLSGTTGATVSLTDNIPRTYTVTATSIIDPTFVCTNTIEVNNPAWITPVFNAQQVSVCPGTPVNIGEAPVTGYSYLWTGNGLSAGNISNPIATVAATSRFPVTVRDDLTGCTTSDTAEVTIYPMPQNVAGDNITICGAGSVQLGSAPVSGVSYLWTPAAGYLPDNTVANPTVVVAGTATYHAEASNLQGCTSSGDITVTVKPPVTPFSFTDQSFCPGNIGEIALPAGPAGMDNYSWSPATEVINPDSNGPDATTLAVLPSAISTYTLTVTNADGCTGQASVRFIPATSVPDAGSNKVICLSDGPVRIGSALNPVGAGISYSWSPSTGLSDPGDPNPLFSPSGAGTTSFILTKEEAGCITQTAVTVTVNDYIMPALSSFSICENSCIQIGFTAAAGVSYTWSPAAGISDPSIANPMACPSITTSYKLTAVGSNGCRAEGTSIVTVLSTTGPAVSVSPLTICLGSGGNRLSADVSPSSGSYLYEWTPGNGTLSNVYAPNPYVYPGSLGTRTYDVKVTDQTTGCHTIATGSMNVISCVLVPVKLELFNAIAKEKKVLVNWTISDQQNVVRYEIEHSTNGRNFYKIGVLTATTQSNYRFLHSSPIAGRNYYRLKVIESGSQDFQYGPIRIVAFDIKEAGVMTMFPNPGRDEVRLLLPGTITGAQGIIQLYDANGKVVYYHKLVSLQATEEINISRLSAGLYAVVVYTSKGIISSKLVVER